MDPITIAMLVAAGVKGLAGIGKSVAGGIQANRAKRDLAKAFPKYSRPEEYNKLLSLYQREAGRGELPGQDRYEAKISEGTARGVRSAAKYADSPVAAVAASSQLYGQQQSAIRDLGLQYAAFQQQANRNLAGALQMGAQYSDKEWWQNVGYPDQVRRNMAAQRYNAGQQNLWGGIDMFGGAVTDAVGAYAAWQGGQPATSGQIQTTPQQTAAMQGNVNAATPTSLNLIGQGSAADMQLFNPYAVSKETFLTPRISPQPMTPYNVYGQNNLLYQNPLG